MTDTKLEISTTAYEWSHGKTPRGRGLWAFEPYRNKDVNAVIFIPVDMTYAEAKREFRKLGHTGHWQVAP